MLKKLQQLDRKILILLSIIPIGCLAAILIGLMLSPNIFSSQAAGQIGSMSPDETEQFVILVASEYAADNDLDKAINRLSELDVPNPDQYVSFLADQYIQQGRDKNDPDLLNVIHLAQALGSSSANMIAYISTPTPLPTNTPLPTDTPVPPTATPLPTDTPIPTETPTPLPPTDTPIPDTPTPAATNTPAPPTAVPATATPVPPAVDFVVDEVVMLTKQENGECMGNHNIFIDIIDANGARLMNAKIGDPPWNNFVRISGEKNEPFTPAGHNYGVKLAEIDLFKGGGTSLSVMEYPLGNPVTSEQTPVLASGDPQIVENGGVHFWIEAGYCSSEADCLSKAGWGNGSNSLCWGHYSYYVRFKATHAF